MKLQHTQGLLRLIVENQKMDIQEILEYLEQLGILDDLSIKRALIKTEYLKRLYKEKNINGTPMSGNQLKMDLAVKYDCSVDHVNNCIYKHSEIRV